MYKKVYFIFVLSVFPFIANSKGVESLNIPFKNSTNNSFVEGLVTVNIDSNEQKMIKVTKDFYGADSHGFSELPLASIVQPLNLGYVKLGGHLHSTYNWELNAYFQKSNDSIYYVYSPLVRRFELIKNNYQSKPMFQVNMHGWQPDKTKEGELRLQNTATANHAGKAIAYINGTKKFGLQNILMGNEPFHSQEVHGTPIPSADEYISKYIEYVLALRNSQEKTSGNSNDIKIWGPEIATGWTGWQTTHPDDCKTDYNNDEVFNCSYGNGKFKEFIPYFLYKISEFEKDPTKNPKKYKMLDYLTFHYYPLFRTDFNDPESIIKNQNGEQNISGMLESVNLWDSENYVNTFDNASPKNITPKILPNFKKWRDQYYPNSKLAVTEFAIDSVDKINYHPIVRPLYLADLMARVANNGVDTFVNSFLQSGTIRNHWALIDGELKTRLYFVYSLFSNYYRGDVVNTVDNLGDSVNSYSVKTASGTNIFLVNKEARKIVTKIQFKTINGIQEITDIELPEWSITTLIVPDNRNEQISVHQYGAKEMEIEIKNNFVY